MAISLPRGSSIFNPAVPFPAANEPGYYPAIGDLITSTRAIGTKAKYTAAEQYQQDAEITAAIASPEAIEAAALATGVDTENMQDIIAHLAHTNYPQYLNLKQGVLGRIRAEVMRSYINMKDTYRQMGYTELQADKIGVEYAKEVKASQMKIYDKMFPHGGQKVENVF